jgi:hypothetical protein
VASGNVGVATSFWMILVKISKRKQRETGLP